MSTLYDLYLWSGTPDHDLDNRIRLEIQRMPGRLRLDEPEDLALHAATEAVVNAVIGPAGAHLFINARNPTRARQEANSRLRSGLRRFRAETMGAAETVAATPDYDLVLFYVKANEGEVRSPGLYALGQSAAIGTLRARCGCPMAELGDADAARVIAAAPSEKRRGIRKAFRFLNRLIAECDSLPADVSACLPATPVVVTDAARTVDWPDLPDALRHSVDTALAEVLAAPELLIADALARLEAGEDPQSVVDDVNATSSVETTNSCLWRQHKRSTAAWLYRGALSIDLAPTTLADLVTVRITRAAIELHIALGKTGSVRPAETTSTLNNRLNGAMSLAGRALRASALAEAIGLLRRKFPAEIRTPHVKGHAQASLALIDEMHDGGPALIARIINAPVLIEEQARIALQDWETMPYNKRLEALKLGAGAAMWALQLCRPRRRLNLLLERIGTSRDEVTRRPWLARTLRDDGKDFVSLTPPGEVKNQVPLEFVVRGQDADVLRWWLEDLRGRYVAERGISNSVYLFPGTAIPQGLRDGLRMPPGCVSGAWFAEAWNAGADIVGLRMTTHKARHAVATAWLTLHPGDFAGVAVLLGIIESTARAKYARDDAAVIADGARQDLQNRFRL